MFGVLTPGVTMILVVFIFVIMTKTTTFITYSTLFLVRYTKYVE